METKEELNQEWILVLDLSGGQKLNLMLMLILLCVCWISRTATAHQQMLFLAT